MKFLLDNNLPPSLCRRLSHLGYEAVHAGKLGLWKAADQELLSLAESRGMVILTHDLDFGQLMAFSEKRKPSIVIFRVQKLGPVLLEKLLTKSWGVIEKPLSEGAIVVIEKEDIRIRKLPIGGTGTEGGPGIHEAPAPYRAGKARSRKRKRK